LIVVTNSDQLHAAIEHFGSAELIAFDVETMGKYRGDPWRNIVTWVSMSDGDYTVAIPMGHPNGDLERLEFPLLKSGLSRMAKGLPLREQDYSRDKRKAKKVWAEPPEQLTRTEVFSALKPLLMGERTARLVGHNLGFDLGSVSKYLGDIPTGPYADTMIAAKVIDYTRRSGYGLKDVAKKYAEIDMVKGIGADVSQHSFSDVAAYSGLDAEATAKVWLAMEPILTHYRLERVFALEMDVLPIVVNMRLNGCLIDTDKLKELESRLESDLNRVEAEIKRMTRPDFNVNSPADRVKLLFAPKSEGGLELRSYVLTDKGREISKAGKQPGLQHQSTSREALEFHQNVPVVKALLEYSEMNKIRSTYVQSYMGGTVVRVVNGKSRTEVKEPLLDGGRLHTDFDQLGAATGRFSSRDPNLQNVPNPDTEYGALIRDLFIAPEGHTLVVADYSQIEPRIIASLSNDPLMVTNYLEGGDIYTTVGDRLGVDRRAGKVAVLSLAYGVGPAKMAAQIGCTISAAKQLLHDFDEQFKSVSAFKSKTIRTAAGRRPMPFVTTLTGRRRWLPELLSREGWLRAKGERKAFNTVIQGSAADIMKIAMVRAQSMIPPQSRLILTIHDELVTVTPEHLADETAEAIREAMEGVNALRLPLKADVVVARTWGEGHK